MIAPAQPSATAGMQTFEVKAYDATNYIESACTCCWCPCCGWTTKTLTLDSHRRRAVLKIDNNCMHPEQKRHQLRCFQLMPLTFGFPLCEAIQAV